MTQGIKMTIKGRDANLELGRKTVDSGAFSNFLLPISHFQSALNLRIGKNLT